MRLWPGESVGIVGESGSGKTTLLRSILGVRTLESGQIRLDGEMIATARGARLRRLRRMIQCVAIARALIVEPRLIALDEAVSALDVTTRAQILALLAEISDSLGLGLLFVSHDLDVVRAITDRVLVMERGRVVESGVTREVFDAPQHPYTASLIAATLPF